MKIVFCSNYMNHHQEEISLNFYKLTNGNYYFIANEPFNEKRLKLGYEDMNQKYDFIVRTYESEAEKNRAAKLIYESDVVIFGYGDERDLASRVKSGKLTFRYAERLLKRGRWFRFFPPKMLRTFNRFVKYKKYSNFNVLCSSAYTSYDLALSGFPPERCYKWGYFPPVKIYDDIEPIIKNKKPKTILWVGRFIDWKHPEIPVLVAEKLKANGFEFEMTIVGAGELQNQISDLVKEKGLDASVQVPGALPPEKVRELMENSEIFIFTSNFKEGWGAVLNEAMNSACACIASHAIGASPYLIKDGINGYLYKNCNLDQIYNKTVDLLSNPSKRQEMSRRAFDTISRDWNSENAASGFVELCNNIFNSLDNFRETGPCSKSGIFKNNWYVGDKDEF